MPPQIGTADGDPPEWTPPSYAKEIDDSGSDEWQPPSYAKPYGEEIKKPSLIKRAIESLKPAEKIHPGKGPKAAIDEFLTSVLSTDKHPYLKRILTSSDPKEESVLPSTSEAGLKEPSTWMGGFSKGLYDEFVRPLTSASGVGMALAFGGEGGKAEPSLRQAKGEIPYRMGGSVTVPEELSQRVLKDGIPLERADKLKNDPYEFAGESIRHPEAKARDFGYRESDIPGNRNPNLNQPLDPEAQSIRDQTKGNYQESQSKVEEKVPEKKSFVNPFEKKPIEEPVKPQEWTPPEYAKPLDERPLPNRSPNLDPNLFHIGEDNPISKGRPTEDLRYDLAREKFNMGRDLPESENPTIGKAEEWKAPEYAKSVEEPTPPDLDEIRKDLPPNPDVAELLREESEGRHYNDNDLSIIEKAPKIPKDDITELHGGLGGIKPSSRILEPNTGPYGAALDKLFNSMGNIQESRLAQDTLNRAEKARRFASFNEVEDVGVKGASKSLSKLKGEYEKVDVEKLKMTQPQVDSLFTAVKRANVTSGEKARGYTALFKLFNGELPQRNELRLLDDVFGNDFSNKILELHGGIGAVGIKLSKVASTMKTMNNMLSLAAPLRHGIGMMGRKEFYPAFRDMFRFFANKEVYDSAMQSIEQHPKYLQAREAGLFLPKSASGADEEFLDSYIGDIPKMTGIPMAAAASKRAYTGFLNKLKFDVYNNMTDRAKDLGYKLFEANEKDPVGVASKEAKGIANFINTFTGRGDLGRLNKMTNELNLLLWSPRMIASRVQMFTSPKLYMDLPKEMRLEGLKGLLAIASLGTIIDTAASYAGAKVSTNILSTDFGKSRFGTHLIDPWGGFQQYIVGAARFLAGKTDSSQPTNRAEIAGRLLANKESPIASLAHTLLTSKFTGKSDDPATAGNLTTQYGQKSSIQREIVQKFLPIFAQDLQDLATSQPDWSENIGLTAAMGAASLAGMSQDYPEKKKGLQFRKPSLKLR